MLQVCVHQHDGVAGRVADAGGERDFLAEVAAERDRLDAAVAGVDLAEVVDRVVARSVVDEHQLPRQSIERVEHRREPGDQPLQVGGLVEDRNDDGEGLAGHVCW